MRIHPATTLALLMLSACEQRPVDPALPVVDSHWRPIFEAQLQGNLVSVAALATDDIYVCNPGFDCDDDGCDNVESAFMHFDGATWQNLPLPPGSTWVREVWSGGPDDIYLAGDGVHHYDGAAWTEELPNGNQVTGAPGTVFASYLETVLQRTPAGWDTLRTFDDIVVELSAGQDGSLLAATPYDVHLWDGLAWQTVAANGLVRDFVCFSAADALIIRSQSGLHLEHWDGAQLTTVSTLAGAPNAIVGRSSNDVFMVGRFGRTQHFDGTVVTEIPRGTSFELRDATVLESGTLVAVGESGKVLAYDGMSWNTLRESTPTHYYVIWAESETRAVISGYDDVFIVDGGSLTEAVLPISHYAEALSGYTIEDVFAISGGYVLHYDGTEWSVAVDSLAQPQIDVWAGPNGAVYSVGNGSMYRGPGAWQRIYDGPLRLLRVNGRNDRVVAIAADEPTQEYFLVEFDGAMWNTYGIPGVPLIDAIVTSDMVTWVLGLDGVYRKVGDTFERVTPRIEFYDFGRFLFEIDAGRLVSFGPSGFAYFDGTLWSLQTSARETHAMTQTLSGTIVGVERGTIQAWELGP